MNKITVEIAAHETLKSMRKKLTKHFIEVFDYLFGNVMALSRDDETALSVTVTTELKGNIKTIQRIFIKLNTLKKKRRIG